MAGGYRGFRSWTMSLSALVVRGGDGGHFAEKCVKNNVPSQSDHGTVTTSRFGCYY